MEVDGVQRRVPWVSVVTGEQNEVYATYREGTGIAKDSIRFERAGVEVPATVTATGWSVPLEAGREGAFEELKAVTGPADSSTTVGKINVVSYAPITRNAYLVPVNGNIPGDVEAVQDELNRIYAGAGVTFNVERHPGATLSGWDMNGNEQLDDVEGADFSSYSEEMKAMIRAFKDVEPNLSSDHYYLFLVTNSASGKSGYMPRKKHFGFIYTDVGANEPHTVAHELGHGAFRLQHVFEQFPTLAEGSTGNLMDYGGGDTLRKYQWDLIHDPEWIITLFDDEEEVALLDTDFMGFLRDISINVSGIPREVLVEMYNTWRAFGVNVSEAGAQVVKILYEQEVIGLEGLHVALDVIGFVPVIGKVADGINGIIYVAEEDYLNATFSGIALVPVAGNAVGKGLKYTLKTLENISPAGEAVVDAFKAAGNTKIVALLSKLAELPSALFDKFMKDVLEVPQLLEKVLNNPILVEAWKVLDEAGETALRKDIGELNLVSKYLDDIEVAGGYKNWKAYDNIFSSSRQRAIEKFGKEAEDLIYVKFKDDGGAAAVILDRYGDTGLAALKKVDNLDGAASELIKGKTMYKHVDENARYLNPHRRKRPLVPNYE